MWIKSKTPKAYCSVCNRPIYDNVDPEKIITCARCVMILHELAQKNPQELVRYRNFLKEKGLSEHARSIESFILDEAGSDIAPFKKNVKLKGFSHKTHRIRRAIRSL